MHNICCVTLLMRFHNFFAKIHCLEYGWIL